MLVQHRLLLAEIGAPVKRSPASLRAPSATVNITTTPWPRGVSSRASASIGLGLSMDA
jgi:hypothetical protein